MNKDLLQMRRRDFIRLSGAAAVGSMIPATTLTAAAEGEVARTVPSVPVSSRRPVNLVSPMVGTGWHGHTFPGAVAPFGLVQLSPDTSGQPERRRGTQRDNYGWDHCSGYHYSDNVVVGFSHTHLQGTGGVDLGDLLLMPMVEGRNWGWDAGELEDQEQAQSGAIGRDSGWVLGEQEKGYRSFFTHEKETARPGFYSVHLDTPDVSVELTATIHCGMHRYHYPAPTGSARQGFMLDLLHGLAGTVFGAELNFETMSRITGSRSTHGWAAVKQVYFAMQFSQSPAAAQVKIDGQIRTASIGDRFSGKEIKAIFTRTPDAAPLIIRVGISCTSIENATANLSAEMSGWQFDEIASQVGGTWNEALKVLDAELPTSSLSRTFYTGAYHSLIEPAVFSDVDGSYRGQDHQNYSHPGFTNYTVLSIWDIYRGEFPFLMLMQPQRTNDIVRTLLSDYQQVNQHSLPMWTLWGNETWSMDGFHAAGMIAAAYVRGFRNFDVELAYAAMRDTALVGSTVKNNRSMQETFRQEGYVPMESPSAGVACTLDLAYDYWCVGAMAELLGKQDDAAMFYKLARNYKNVFDPATGFMRGRGKDGKWREPFRPDQEYLDYVETDAWQATFNVMHDVQGLIDLYGGDAAFIAKLDALFTAPSYVVDARPDISGMVGQDAQGNEPSNHIPYLYCFAGAPWKTQYWVRKVAALYNDKPEGIPGNDDCGQLSSWFVFAALGFYPVNAVTGVYVIGSPLVRRASIHNQLADTTFAVIAENNSAENIFIQSATMNGKKLTRCWLTHSEILAGGELRFLMGSKPNKEWASGPSDRPSSGLIRNPVSP